MSNYIINSDDESNDNNSINSYSSENQDTQDTQLLERALQESKREYEEKIKRDIPKDFIYYYQIQPLLFYPRYSDEKNKEYEYTNQVILPEEILKDIAKLDNCVNGIFTFKITSNNGESCIVIPSEFIISDTIYVPNHIHTKLKITEEEFVKIELLKPEDIKKGEYMLLEVENSEFLKVKDIKTMLELSIISKYSAIQKGDRLIIYSQEIQNDLSFKVKDCSPDIMLLTNSDIEVDFDIPDNIIPNNDNDNDNNDNNDKGKKKQSHLNFITNQEDLPSLSGIGMKLDDTDETSLTNEEIRLARLKRFTKT